jgi:hypothetical protein
MAACLVPRAARAQRAQEWRIQAIGLAAPDWFLGGGGAFGVRSRSGIGAGVVAALGSHRGRVGGRGEAVVSFYLDPLRERGLAPYAAGGVGVTGDRTGAQEYLVVLVGVATNPGSRRGWFVEAGLGGGVRLSAGIAFRRLR